MTLQDVGFGTLALAVVLILVGTNAERHHEGPGERSIDDERKR